MFADAVIITQPPTINNLKVCQWEVEVDGWHNIAQAIHIGE